MVETRKVEEQEKGKSSQLAGPEVRDREDAFAIQRSIQLASEAKKHGFDIRQPSLTNENLIKQIVRKRRPSKARSVVLIKIKLRFGKILSCFCCSSLRKKNQQDSLKTTHRQFN